MPDYPSTSSEPSDPSQLDIKSLLLLDDDEDLADTLKALLEAHNFVVTVVNNGAEGLREVIDVDFDVIVCDLMMPQMPGDMFYLAVQKTKPELCNRFIFITGETENPKVEDFLQQVNGLALFKPVPIDELISMISFVLKRTSSAAAQAEL